MNKKDLELIPVQSSIVGEVDKLDLSNVEYEALVQMGIDVSEAKSYAQWVLGKLGAAITDSAKHGDLKKYCNDIRQDYRSVVNYVTTYRKYITEDPTFSPTKYAGSVPWGVIALAATSSDAPQKVLDNLQDTGNDTNIESAYRKIMTDKSGIEVPAKPKLHLNWDQEVSKYKLRMNPDDFPLIDWSDIKEQLKAYIESLA